MKKIFSIIFACLLPAFAQAQSVKYVTDELTVTVRKGQGNDYQILRMIRSGTRVQTLEETDTDYTRVRLSDGKEGWVLSRYLTNTPIARIRLAQAQRSLEQLKEENNRLRKEKQALEQNKANTTAELASLNEDREQMSAEITELRDLAAHPRELATKNNILREQIVNLEGETRMLQAQNSALRDSSNRDWFLTGGSVLFGGIILGLLIPKVRWRRKSTWDRF